MFKKSLLLLATGTALLGAASSFRAAPPDAWFPFSWYGAKVDGKYFDKLAILVPVKVGELRGNFVTQFDLGSDATLLYEETVKNYFASRRQLYALVDTTRRGTSDTGSHHYPTQGLPFRLGAVVIPRPLLLTGQGDFLKDKVLVIDLPGRRMAVLDSVDATWRARTAFVPARIKNNRFHIPLTINKRTYWTLFDTGASLFAFNTDYATWRGVVGRPANLDSLHVNSWGKQVAFYGAPLRYDAYLGRVKLPRATAWYTRDARHLAFNKSEQIDATTGNAFFFHNTVVLDFRHRRFGVVK